MHQSLILQLFELGAIRFGSFTLKSGSVSPIYLDLRMTISRPKLLGDIAEELYRKIASLPFDLLCGVPYTALPFASVISIQHDIPMVLRRKEKKEYGTGKILEGIFTQGDRCLIIEDVITSGSSILETAQDLRREGLVVEHAAVLVDREQGGIGALAKEGIAVHAVLTLTEILDLLLKEKKIDQKARNEFR